MSENSKNPNDIKAENSVASSCNRTHETIALKKLTQFVKVLYNYPLPGPGAVIIIVLATSSGSSPMSFPIFCEPLSTVSRPLTIIAKQNKILEKQDRQIKINLQTLQTYNLAMAYFASRR